MLLVLAGILLVLMLAVGGDRGGKSFIALAGNAGVFILCVSLIALGANVYLTTGVCAVLFCAVTLVYQNGRGVKTRTALLAVVLDVLLVAGVALVVEKLGKLAGYSELDMREEVSMYLSAELHIDMRALGLAAIVFGLLGAAMDAAVSVAAAVYEVHLKDAALPAHALTRAGNAVGRDILGTTVNTLFFAGIGETIMQTILFMKNGYGVEAILNSKAFVQMFSEVMVSNLACLAVIPLTALLAGRMMTGEFPAFRAGGWRKPK
jgi:uncharacterized membrane protein